MNSAIEVGNVAYLKTTEEPVFVMAIDNGTALVRRPLQGDRGVTHIIETFGVAELETREQKTVGDAKFLKFQLDVRDQTARERQAASKVSAASDEPQEGYIN